MPRRIKRRKPKLLKLPSSGTRTVTNSGMNDEQLLARREQAFNLRIDEGLSYREIAEKMGTDKSTANKDCKVIAKMKFEGMIQRDNMVMFEHEAHYDRLLTMWAPLLQPLIEGKLIVGDTKYDRKGQAYDITIPNYESAKTATEMILKAMSQREKLHGFQAPLSDGKPSPEAFENAGKAIFEFMRSLVAKPEPKTIEATEVIEHVP